MRHGETAWSLSGQHTSRTDLPLTPRGEEDVRSLGARIDGSDFSYAFVSPSLRARQTCAILGFDSMARIDADLVEWDYGELEGRRTIEIRVDWPDWNVFRDGCPSGESPEQMTDRADRVIARLRSLESSVLLVSHGHFLRALAVRWIGLPIEQARHFPLETASLSVLGFDPGTENAPIISSWNTSKS